MGKKPWLGLVGVVWFGLAFTGCETFGSKDKDKKFNPTPTVQLRDKPGATTDATMGAQTKGPTVPTGFAVGSDDISQHYFSSNGGAVEKPHLDNRSPVDAGTPTMLDTQRNPVPPPPPSVMASPPPPLTESSSSVHVVPGTPPAPPPPLPMHVDDVTTSHRFGPVSDGTDRMPSGKPLPAISMPSSVPPPPVSQSALPPTAMPSTPAFTAPTSAPDLPPIPAKQ